MQLGMIGLGRMGAAMVRRLAARGHDCVVHDADSASVAALAQEGFNGANSLAELAGRLSRPRTVWVMVPAGVVDGVLQELATHLEAGDIVIDGGNSYYRDDIRRAKRLAATGLHYVDVGTSGGVAGLERGYCLMTGGDAQIVAHLEPIFESLAPGVEAAGPTNTR